LIQALINIYNNAKDAIDESKTEEKYFFIDVTCKGREGIIVIKDSGKGINEDILDKIFEPYFTTKHKSKGTGLGLYIAYTIVTQHLKGTIQVKNREYDYQNKHLYGVEFVITIPLQ
jgi:signal transduction histidine kinase